MLVQPDNFEGALLFLLLHETELTRKRIDDCAIRMSSKFQLPCGTKLELIIENVANRLIEGKTV